jgi:membrane protein DedA with SNARE-associated domain
MIDFFASLQQVFDYMSGQAVWWGLLLLAVSAMVEYVVPPFPGDTVTLAGAVLIPQAGWPVWGVFGAVMVGTALGAAVDWRAGVWLVEHDGKDTWLHRWLDRPKVRPRVDTLIGQFERYGTIYIAAGMARIDLFRTLLWGCLGAALWNAVILGAGYTVGYNLQELAVLLDQYSRVFWIVLAVVVLGWILWKAWGLLSEP